MAHATVLASIPMSGQHAGRLPSSKSRLAQSPLAQPRLRGQPALRAAGRAPLRAAAEGQSFQASYSTGGASGGRSGAAQLREEPAEAAQAPLDATASPSDSGAVLQEAADYMSGELRRMFSSGVGKLIFGPYVALPVKAPHDGLVQQPMPLVGHHEPLFPNQHVVLCHATDKPSAACSRR